MTSENTEKRLLLAFLLLALVLRATWIAAIPNEPVSDQVIYHVSATRIAEGAGYVDDDGQPANYWPVGYAGYLAAVYALAGPSPRAAACVNLIAGLALVLGLSLLARDLYGLRAGRWAALIGALYPTFVIQSTTLASEVLFLPGLVWMQWLFLRVFRSERGAAVAAGAGLFLGLLVLVRPTALILPAALVVSGWALRAPLPRIAARTAIVVLLAGVVLVPWSARNATHFGEWTPMPFNGGANLWMGNHPGANGEYTKLPEDVSGMPLAERDALLRERAVAFIRSEPLAFLRLALRRTVVSLRSDTNAADWSRVGIAKTLGEGALMPIKLLCTVAYGLLLTGTLWALIVRARRRDLLREDLVVLTLLALNAVPFVVIVAQNRYAMPLLPLWALLAASVARLSRRNSRRTSRGAAATPPSPQANPLGQGC